MYAQTNNGTQTTPYYYYYQGEKIYLNLNTQSIFLDTQSNFNATELDNQGLLSFQLKVDDTPVNGETKKWARIKIDAPLTEAEYFQKLNNLKLAAPSIDLIQPSFITMDGNEIDMSSYFYVKLNQASDLTLLQQEANDKNVLIIRQNQFMPLWYTLRLTNQTNDNTLNVANYFYENGYFSTAEPNFISDNYLQCSDDPLFPIQWGLENTENNVGDVGIDINICDAWDIATGNGINVAVVDDGFELNHPDLINNVSSLSYDGVTASPPSIVYGSHGTAVAGIIGAEKDNDLGIVGVAPNCNLMSASVNFNITNEEQFANSINWAWQNGADVINCSWGGSTSSGIISDAILDAFNEGRDELGSIVVFSAGNGNTNVSFPANSHPRVLAVGAISPCGERKDPNTCDDVCWIPPNCDGGSNYGSQLDIVAPGSLIPTTDRVGNNGYVSGDYRLDFGGTSAAAPSVAGVAALILSVNPDLTVYEVNSIIENTAQKVGGYNYQTYNPRPNGTWNNEMGYGLVDAHQAVLQAQNYYSPIIADEVVCASPLPPTIFTIENADPPYSWDTSTNLEIIGPNDGSSVTVSAVNASTREEGYVEVTYNGGSNTTIVWVGKPLAPTILNGPEFVDTGSWQLYHGGAAPGATSYTWVLPYDYDVVNPVDQTSDNWQMLPNNTGWNSNIFTGQGEYSGEVQLISRNKCSNPDINQGSSINIYVEHENSGNCTSCDAIPPSPIPNSADENFKLDFTSYPEGTYYIYIYDQYSNVMYEGESGNIDKTVETVNIPNGTYYLHIHDGNGVITKQLIINH